MGLRRSGVSVTRPLVDLESRVRRIYAIDAAADEDLSKVQPTRGERGGRTTSFHVDFSLPDEQLANLAYSAIGNVARFKDHLRGFARRQGQDPVALTLP